MWDMKRKNLNAAEDANNLAHSSMPSNKEQVHSHPLGQEDWSGTGQKVQTWTSIGNYKTWSHRYTRTVYAQSSQLKKKSIQLLSLKSFSKSIFSICELVFLQLILALNSPQRQNYSYHKRSYSTKAISYCGIERYNSTSKGEWFYNVFSQLII